MLLTQRLRRGQNSQDLDGPVSGWPLSATKGEVPKTAQCTESVSALHYSFAWQLTTWPTTAMRTGAVEL